ncbi:protein of unknown function [Ruminococcaceae bacterium BL-4]|nr:protein of unknown function [Ruminococcaceae bacterium BL-4]
MERRLFCLALDNFAFGTAISAPPYFTLVNLSIFLEPQDEDLFDEIYNRMPLDLSFSHKSDINRGNLPYREI